MVVVEEEEKAFCGRNKSEREREREREREVCVLREKVKPRERDRETVCVCVWGARGVWMGSVRRVCVLFDVEVFGIAIARFWFWRLGAAK